MIETAKGIIKDNIEFQQMDINEIDYKNEFDIIFSNAALHWIKDHKRLLENAYQALKFQGIILWDFGGAGNCANFIDVIREKITDSKFTEYFRTFEWPWFMPSKSQYEELISSVSFSEFTITEVNRDRHFSNAEEMIRWIDQDIKRYVNQYTQFMRIYHDITGYKRLYHILRSYNFVRSTAENVRRSYGSLFIAFAIINVIN